MRTYRRLSLACAATAFLIGCTTKSDIETADADLLRGEISAAIGDASLIERDYGLTAGRVYVEPDRNVRVKIASFDALPGWAADDHAAGLRAFKVSCAKILKLRSAKVLGGLGTEIEDWRPVCLAAQSVDPRAAKAFFEQAFQPVRLKPSKRALVTSYFEPELRASRRSSGAYVHALYARPPELVSKGGVYGMVKAGQIRPYLTRGQIYRGGLRGRKLEIAYLDDAVDNFFLHVQGSGRLRFPDGSTTRVAFSAKNGYPYKSVGREMIRRGLTTRGRASAKVIQDYVRANPAKGLDLLATNKSFIFFREVTGLRSDSGPLGALGVQLSDGRSIAIDRRYNTLGAPVWLMADNSPTGPIRRLVIAQDTGSAIKGAQRADLFWGTGDRAGALAGRMKHRGSLTIFLPKATVKRLIGRSKS
ncbi:MAG: MltA domain-containing protein [Neomegalonema sp.]|nr:MltA domain-containing protein [Neomegalonema sp.]